MNIQRISLAAIAATLLVAGLWLHLAGNSSQQSLAGITARVGFMLAAIWLAFPQLESLKHRMSALVLGGLLAVLLVVAIRPRLFPIAAGIAIAVIFINGAMRRLARAKP